MIMAQTQSNIAHRWSLIIKANGVEYKPLYFDDVNLDRLYHKNYADELMVKCTFTYSDYQTGIVPYKDRLEATLVKIPLNAEVDPSVNTQKSQQVSVYKVQLQNADSSNIAGDNPLAVNKAMAQKASMQTVSLQLFNPVIDTLRKKTMGTVFRDTNPIEACAYVLLKYGKTEGAETNHNVNGVQIDSTFKEIERNHIPIPHNTPIVEVPYVIDRLVGGTHPAQMRYYLQSQIWHIYPIFDHQRFKDNQTTLTVIKIPKNRLASAEKTFRTTGTQVIILTTRETTHKDTSEAQQLNQGNGVRFVDSNKILDDYYAIQNNKATTSAKDNLNEVVYEPRADGSNNMGANVGFTDKYNMEYAKLARNSGAYIQTIWENSNPDLLRPGMPVRYIFQDGANTKELYGTLNAVEAMDFCSTKNISEQRFTTISLLTIFVSRLSPLVSAASPTVTTSSTTTT